MKRKPRPLYRDAGSLFLTAAELLDQTLLVFLQVDHLDRTFDGCFSLGIRELLRQTHLRGVVEHVEDGQVVVNDICLRDVSDDLLEGVEVLIEVGAVDADGTLCRQSLSV